VDVARENARALVDLYAEAGSPTYDKAAVRWLARYALEAEPDMPEFVRLTLELKRQAPSLVALRLGIAGAGAYPQRMRRLRPAVLLLTAGAILLLVAPVGSFAGSSAERATGASFTLQKPAACVAPATVLGRACVDKSHMVVADKWVVNDGSAQRNTDLYLTSFSWNVPATIPAAGGSITLKLTAAGLQGNRICPALTVAGSFGSANLLKCAESGQTVPGNLTVKLVPPSAAPGTTASLTVAVLDGPVYTYNYRAGTTAATPKKCRAPLRLPASTNAETRGRYFVRFNFDVLQVIPNVWVKRTAGTGAFYVLLSADDSKACTDEGRLTIRHEFEPLQGKDRRINFSSSKEENFCLHLKGRRTKVLTARIEAFGYDNYRRELCERARVSGGRANAESGGIIIRAGEPFNLAHIGLCGRPYFRIREKYWPVGEHPAKVKVQIDITPTGVT
jgi:hypothetical protein